MARTVAGSRPASLTTRPPYRGERGEACEFCRARTPEGVRHDLCPGSTHTTAPGRKDNKQWDCKCHKEGHPR